MREESVQSLKIGFNYQFHAYNHDLIVETEKISDSYCKQLTNKSHGHPWIVGGQSVYRHTKTYINQCGLVFKDNL